MSSVTIIIPCYNSGSYIRQTLDSLLEQTNQDFNIIIVDDGSSDNLTEVLMPYFVEFNDRLEYIYQNNQGQSSARNNGITKATTEFIVFLDSDDYLAPESIEVRLKCFRDRPEIDLLHTDAYLVENNKILELTYKDKYGGKVDDDALLNLLKQNFIILSTVMVKKEVLLSSGLFDKKIISAEDYDLWIRIAKKFNIYYLNTPLAYYTIRTGSLSKELNLSNYMNNILIVYRKILSLGILNHYEESALLGNIKILEEKRSIELVKNHIRNSEFLSAKNLIRNMLATKLKLSLVMRFLLLTFFPSIYKYILERKS